MAFAARADAEPPSVSYIFPAGGQRGTTVDVRVGGHFLHGECAFEMLGAGIEASPRIREVETTWFEGPLIPMPASQAAEDYPRDHAGQVRIAGDAAPGPRYWQVWTSQGATPAMKFVVGELPEIVEQEIDGQPLPTSVELPVTINGRIFPREDVDIWLVELRSGESLQAEVEAARLGSGLDAELAVFDPRGRRIAENSDLCGTDPGVWFTAAEDGPYQIRIFDAAYGGLQHFVYRLSLRAAPRLEAVFPLGGRRGTTVDFQLTLGGLPGTTIPLQLPVDAPRDISHIFAIGGASTNPCLLELDGLDEFVEAEPNDELPNAPLVPVSAVLNGRIDPPGDADQWCFTAHAGDVLAIDLRAARLGSPLDAIIVVSDATGKELARADDAGDGQTDATLTFTVPADGNYGLRILERFASRGGPRFAYRLRVDKPPAPDFRLLLAADAITVIRGAEIKLVVTAERTGGFAEPIALSIDGLPAGVSAEGLTIAAGAGGTEIVLKTLANAGVGASRLTIRGIAMIDGAERARTAVRPAPRGTPELSSALLAVAMPTPFKVSSTFLSGYAPRGTVCRRHFRIERAGYEGPLVVKLADRQFRHLQGVTGPEIVVPPGVHEFDYPVQLPPKLEIERTSRTVIMTLGEVVDEEGKSHTVSYTSTAQEDQIVLLASPSPLTIEADVASVTAGQGKAADVSLRVARSSEVTGPTRIELVVPSHVRGVAADPMELSADQSQASFRVRFEPNYGPCNCPLIIRATSQWNGDPVIAETKLDLVPLKRQVVSSQLSVVSQKTDD